MQTPQAAGQCANCAGSLVTGQWPRMYSHEEELVPPVGPVFPLGHAAQLVKQPPPLNLPAEHGGQKVPPLCQYVPGGQLGHCAEAWATP